MSDWCPKLKHLDPECISLRLRGYSVWGTIEETFDKRLDVTGVYFWSCIHCGYFEHAPLSMRSPRWIGSPPEGPYHDDQGEWYERDQMVLPFDDRFKHWKRRPVVETKETISLRNPVPIVFDPNESCRLNDGKEHEGVKLREIWRDPLARTLWLGIKPLIITSQYFRGSMIAEAERLRKHPERLLEEYIHISTGDWWSPSSNLFNLLAPYLITCLQDEGSWPYIRIPPQRLAWKVVPKERDA